MHVHPIVIGTITITSIPTRTPRLSGTAAVDGHFEFGPGNWVVSVVGSVVCIMVCDGFVVSMPLDVVGTFVVVVLQLRIGTLRHMLEIDNGSSPSSLL